MNTKPVAIPADLALRAVQAEAAAADVELLLPGRPEREAILLGMAAYHAISGHGWDLAHAREHVSVTLPGAGPVLDLLAMVPVVGPILAALSSGFRRTTVMLAPSAMRDGVVLMGTWRHETGHVGQIARGHLPWCLAYGMVPEVRAGAEAPCYGSDLAHQVLLAGSDVDKVEAAALANLERYGLDEAGLRLARGIVRANAETLRGGVDPGDVVADTLRSLRAVGWPG